MQKRKKNLTNQRKRFMSDSQLVRFIKSASGTESELLERGRIHGKEEE